MDDSANNPLLEPLPTYVVLDDWPKSLDFNPLDELSTELTLELRDQFLGRANERFVTTKSALRIAFDVQSMIRASYRERNPCSPQNRKKIFEISKLDEDFDTKDTIFYPNARCKMISAITGAGKTTTLMRVLSIFDQVVVHGKRRDARWLKHVQVVYLIAKMPGDGSRSGLLEAILAALDSAINTDYFNTFSARKMKIESLTLKVAQILAQHSVGLLVLEEMQAENFTDSKYRKELQLFFLGLLSFGIPLVLVGNPRAFECLNKFKQTESRFFSVEPEEMWPVHDYRDSDWANAIAPALWEYQVVDEAEPFSADVAKALWECSGGLPGYARRLITEVQKTILFGVEKSLSADALRRQFKVLASFRQFRPLIEGLTTFDEQKLVESGGEDIPISQFVKRWASLELLKTEPDDADEGKAPPKPKMGDGREHIARKKAQKKSAATKRRRKTERNAALQEQIPTDDLRFGENIKDALARGLSELKDDIATGSDSKQKSKKKN